MNETTPAIMIKDASLSYGDKMLFNNLSLSIKPGKITCLMGPSGTGKTTLLRMMANLIPEQDKNTVFSGQISCKNNKNLEEQLAYLAQDDSLLPWLTTLDNTLIGHRLRGESSKASHMKAIHILHELGLKGAEKKYPHQLSGGMRQRVALARTLFENKPIILMDEPFAALDAITRYELQTLVCQALQHRTVIIVTHDPMEALRMGDEIYILSGEPATLRYFPVANTEIPRNPSDQTFAKQQAELYHALSQAKG